MNCTGVARRHPQPAIRSHPLIRLADRMAPIGSESPFEAAARARTLEAGGRSIIHLEIGEPDFDTPPNIRAAAQRALDAGGRTSDRRWARPASASKLSRGAAHRLGNAGHAWQNVGDGGGEPPRGTPRRPPLDTREPRDLRGPRLTRACTRMTTQGRSGEGSSDPPHACRDMHGPMGPGCVAPWGHRSVSSPG